MAVCKICGKKYSKWTTPVSARGICVECFASQVQNEPQIETKEQFSDAGNLAEESADEFPKAIMIVTLALIVIAGLILVLFASFIGSAFHLPLLYTLRGAEWFTMLLANLVVVFYCFPAFTRTKDRAFLCIAFAALSFAYTALFSLLLGVGAPAMRWRVSHLQAEWYYTTRYVIGVIALILYAYGIASLARRSRASRAPSV